MLGIAKKAPPIQKEVLSKRNPYGEAIGGVYFASVAVGIVKLSEAFGKERAIKPGEFLHLKTTAQRESRSDSKSIRGGEEAATKRKKHA